MPKRVIDFEAMWASDKLAACAEWAQAEYAWLYGLADANGSFEITNLRVIWGRAAAVRKNLSIERLEQVFDEFRDKGLLFVWEEHGKRYAHWTGSDRPGRLPAPSLRNRFERRAPPVPRARLAVYEAGLATEAPAVSKLKPCLESTQAQDLDRERDREVAVEPEPSDAAGVPLAFEGRRLKITQEQHEKLQGAYQGLDVAAHYAEMDLWLEAKGARRKNAFLFARNWLSREVRSDGTNHIRGARTRVVERRQRTARALSRVFGPPGGCQSEGFARGGTHAVERAFSASAASGSAATLAGGVQRALPAGDHRAERPGIPRGPGGPDPGAT